MPWVLALTTLCSIGILRTRWDRDTKENQVIAVLSLGAEWTPVMTPHVSSRGMPKVSCGTGSVFNGNLLVMEGDIQENWKVSHCVLFTQDWR